MRKLSLTTYHVDFTTIACAHLTTRTSACGNRILASDGRQCRICSPIPPALLELPPLDMKKRIKELMLQPTTARMQPCADVTDFMQRAALRVPAVYSLHCRNSQSRTCCCWEFLSKQRQDPGLSQTGHDPWQAWL